MLLGSEDIGLDLLVHGEPERNEMVQYFADQVSGMISTGHGWVQSYGNRSVRPHHRRRHLLTSPDDRGYGAATASPEPTRAAQRLGVDRKIMYGLVGCGAIESVKIGRLRRVPADALVTFLDELRAGRKTGAA